MSHASVSYLFFFRVKNFAGVLHTAVVHAAGGVGRGGEVEAQPRQISQIQTQVDKSCASITVKGEPIRWLAQYTALCRAGSLKTAVILCDRQCCTNTDSSPAYAHSWRSNFSLLHTVGFIKELKSRTQSALQQSQEHTLLQMSHETGQDKGFSTMDYLSHLEALS